MKQILTFFSFLLIVFLLVGCGKKTEPSVPVTTPTPTITETEPSITETITKPTDVSINITDNDIELLIDDTFNLSSIITTTVDKPVFNYEIEDDSIITITNNIITGIKAGSTSITASINGYPNVSETINITVLPINIFIDDEVITIHVNQGYGLYPRVEGIDDYEFIYTVVDSSIASMSYNIIKGLKIGTTTLEITLRDRPNVKPLIIAVEVLKELDPSITLTGPTELEINDVAVIVAELTDLEGTIRWSTSNSNIVTVDTNGLIKAIKEGEATITAQCGDYTAEILITVLPDEVAPMFVLDENYLEHTIINWNKFFNPLKGVLAVDNIDGDITDSIIVSDFDNQQYGIQEVILTSTDSHGNTATLTRTVEVIWDYDVNFIGHAGSYYGLMNSEEAILYGIQVLKYQAIEVDLKQSKDGVFILSHDDDFGGYTLQNYNWDILKDVTVTQGRNAGIPSSNGSVVNSPYTTKLLTLERYLQICKEYNVKAVIELKYSPGITNGDQSRMQALMDEIEANDMLDDVIFLGSQYNCLIWTRNNGYGFIPCQYLVTTLESNSFLNRCIEYNLDISFNISYENSIEWIAKYKEQGLKIACYTFTQYSDYSLVQQWIDKGVDYVTVDWQKMDMLNLPEKSSSPTTTYTVTFKDYDNKILKTATVNEGAHAAPPTTPTRAGYEFTGWDKDISSVTSNLTVIATYQIINYTIIYNANLASVTESSWANKEDFINEFYNDFFNWALTKNGLEGVTVTGNTINVKRGLKDVTVSSVSELKALDIYDFEPTFGSMIYMPFNRIDNNPVIMEENENYFLNSKEYRLKYQDLDQYFLNVLINSYPSYDRGYNLASNNRVQIFFRFHQWATKGTNIALFNNIPKKYIISVDDDFNYTLPETSIYTVLDEFDLPPATGDKTFVGWYLDIDLTIPITSIEKGSTGNLVVYAKWND